MLNISGQTVALKDFFGIKRNGALSGMCVFQIGRLI